MAKYDNIKSLLASIISKNYDSIGMCYYPVSDQNVTSYGNNTITKINGVTANEKKRITSKINFDRVIKKNIMEYGIRDIYVRVTDNENTQVTQKHKYFFRKICYKITLANVKGIFVLEIFTACDAEDFPILVNYPHHIHNNIDSYVIVRYGDPLNLCFTKSDDDETNTRDAIMHISRDIVDKIVDVDILQHKLNSFFDDVILLKNDVMI